MLNKFNMSLIEENDFLLLAVSGGIDSMVLLHYLFGKAEEMNLTIAVAYLDHMKRRDSHLDKELIEATCNKLSVDCYSGELEINIEENFHDYAHMKRYDFFAETAKEIGAKKVVLAHNANDNAETILMRLTRGSSFEGYRGILPETEYKGVKIIRPLISVSRSDIEEYQKYYNVQFNEDSSNSEDFYTRNRYRHHVMPFLENENPKVFDKFLQFSIYQDKAYQLIEKTTDVFLADNLIKYKDSYALDTNAFNLADPIVKIESIKKIVNQKTDNTVELTFTNISDIIRILENDKPHVELSLGENLFIHKSYNLVYFRNQKPSSRDFSFVIDHPQNVELPDGGLVIITKNPNKYYGIMYKLCYNNLDFTFPLTIRNRLDGDRLKTSTGTKKLKDVFINKKVPMNVRDSLPIVLDKDQEILWIPDIFEAKSTGDDILYIIYQEGKENA